MSTFRTSAQAGSAFGDVTVVLINGASFTKLGVWVVESDRGLTILESETEFSWIPYTSILYFDFTRTEETN